jgi:hypothetical protein
VKRGSIVDLCQEEGKEGGEEKEEEIKEVSFLLA